MYKSLFLHTLYLVRPPKYLHKINNAQYTLIVATCTLALPQQLAIQAYHDQSSANITDMDLTFMHF